MLKKDHLQLLMQSYGLNASDSEFLQCSQNFVYKASRPSGTLIIRICRGRYRNEIEVEAELRWIEYLIDRGIRACRPLRSTAGQLFHSFEIDGERSIVTAFEHAPGAPVERKLANESAFEELGKLTGQMHAVACEFNEDKKLQGRRLWRESRLLDQDLEECSRFLSKPFRESVENLIHELNAIPKARDNFGMIHGDINFGNIFKANGELWIFDFDNCEYGYFIQDLATILWDSIYCKALVGFADDELNNRMEPFWGALLKGYAQTTPVKEIDLFQLKRFFILREAIIYVHYHRTLNVSEMDESFREGLDVMRRNVETQDHQVDFSRISERQIYIKTVLTAPLRSA